MKNTIYRDNTLPSWISGDRDVLRMERTAIDESYMSGREYALNDTGLIRCINNRETRNEIRRIAIHHLERMIDGVIPDAHKQLNTVQAAQELPQIQRKPKRRTPEFFIFAGAVPHILASGVGRRMWPGVQLIAVLHDDDTVIVGFEEWRDKFLIRAQAFADCYSALPRRESRTSDFRPIMQPLIHDAQAEAVTLLEIAERVRG